MLCQYRGIGLFTLSVHYLLTIDNIDALDRRIQLAAIQVVDTLGAVAVDGAQLLDARNVLQGHADDTYTGTTVFQQIGTIGQDAGGTVIYGDNSLGDRSYCDMIYEGVELTAQELGLRTMQLSPQSTEEGIRYLELMTHQMEAAQDSVRRLFIVTSPVYDDYLRTNSNRLSRNPNADLLYLETRTPLPGKGSTLYLPYYGAMFEAGAMMPALGASVMLIGANRREQAVVEAIQGFTDGWNADMTTVIGKKKKHLNTTYLDETGEGGYIIADTTAMRMIHQWVADSIYDIVPVCGGAFNTFWRMNEIEFDRLFIVGIDNEYHARNSHLSVVKHIDRAMSLCTEQYKTEVFAELTEQKLKEIHETALRREEGGSEK